MGRCKFSNRNEDCTLTHYNFNFSVNCDGLKGKKDCPLWNKKWLFMELTKEDWYWLLTCLKVTIKALEKKGTNDNKKQIETLKTLKFKCFKIRDDCHVEIYKKEM